MASAVDMARHCALIALYLCLNCSLNMINRYVLGIYGFAFPMLLTICHMLFGFVALFVPVMLARRPEVHRQTWRRQWKGFLCVGSFMAMNIGLNNISLVSLPLSLNQVLRCAAFPSAPQLRGLLVEAHVRTPAVGRSRLQWVRTAGLQIANRARYQTGCWTRSPCAHM